MPELTASEIILIKERLNPQYQIVGEELARCDETIGNGNVKHEITLANNPDAPTAEELAAWRRVKGKQINDETHPFFDYCRNGVTFSDLITFKQLRKNHKLASNAVSDLKVMTYEQFCEKKKEKSPVGKFYSEVDKLIAQAFPDENTRHYMLTISTQDLPQNATAFIRQFIYNAKGEMVCAPYASEQITNYFYYKGSNYAEMSVKLNFKKPNDRLNPNAEVAFPGEFKLLAKLTNKDAENITYEIIGYSASNEVLYNMIANAENPFTDKNIKKAAIEEINNENNNDEINKIFIQIFNSIKNKFNINKDNSGDCDFLISFFITDEKFIKNLIAQINSLDNLNAKQLTRLYELLLKLSSEYTPEEVAFHKASFDFQQTINEKKNGLPRNIISKAENFRNSAESVAKKTIAKQSTTETPTPTTRQVNTGLKDLTASLNNATKCLKNPNHQYLDSFKNSVNKLKGRQRHWGKTIIGAGMILVGTLSTLVGAVGLSASALAAFTGIGTPLAAPLFFASAGLTVGGAALVAGGLATYHSGKPTAQHKSGHTLFNAMKRHVSNMQEEPTDQIVREIYQVS